MREGKCQGPYIVEQETLAMLIKIITSNKNMDFRNKGTAIIYCFPL